MPRRQPSRRTRIQDVAGRLPRRRRIVLVKERPDLLKRGVRIFDGINVFVVDDLHRRHGDGQMIVRLRNPVTEQIVGDYPVGSISSDLGGAGELAYV